MNFSNYLSLRIPVEAWWLRAQDLAPLLGYPQPEKASEGSTGTSRRVVTKPSYYSYKAVAVMPGYNIGSRPSSTISLRRDGSIGGIEHTTG